MSKMDWTPETDWTTVFVRQLMRDHNMQLTDEQVVKVAGALGVSKMADEMYSRVFDIVSEMQGGHDEEGGQG